MDLWSLRPWAQDFKLHKNMLWLVTPSNLIFLGNGAVDVESSLCQRNAALFGHVYMRIVDAMVWCM